MSKQHPSQSILGGAILLTAHQYCHLLNTKTGNVRLVEGPCRINRVWAWIKNETMYGSVQEKITLKEGQYAIIANPYSVELCAVKHGEREIRIGPCIFSLYPGELLEGDSIYTEYILSADKGLLLKALMDFDDHGVDRKAGEFWIIPGPTRYIPPLTVQVVSQVDAISLGKNEGLYIKNQRNGQVRLERGPKTIILSPEEVLYQKLYCAAALEALKLSGKDFDASRAFQLRLLSDEVMLIVSEDQQRLEIGPKEIFLEPFEKIKILTISGCTPKKPGVLKLWRVYVGPVFCSDELVVRTQDNAELKLLVRYKIHFKIENHDYGLVFAIEDFIGFATETMASIIREEAAHHNFEELHSKAAELFKIRIFGKEDGSYTFKENHLEIFGLDIKRIAPVDEQIASQLNAAIKSNMDVYVKKIQQTAQLEAEQSLVQGKIKIEQTKKALITLEQENNRLQQLTEAKIDADAQVERAQGEAKAIQIKGTAAQQLECEKMTQTLQLLQNSATDAFLRLEQVRSFNNVEKTVVLPSDAKIWVPFEVNSPKIDPKLGKNQSALMETLH